MNPSKHGKGVLEPDRSLSEQEKDASFPCLLPSYTHRFLQNRTQTSKCMNDKNASFYMQYGCNCLDILQPPPRTHPLSTRPYLDSVGRGLYAAHLAGRQPAPQWTRARRSTLTPSAPPTLSQRRTE